MNLTKLLFANEEGVMGNNGLILMMGGATMFKDILLEVYWAKGIKYSKS